MLMTDTSAFASRLDLIMKARGISQTDLANAVGLRPQSVHQWVKAKSQPKTGHWKAISETLRTTERWLFWGEGSMNETDSAPKGTLLIPHYENSVTPIDRHLGREVPLIELEGISVSNDSVQPVKLPTPNVNVQAKFPTGERSVAFIMRDRSMEPEIQQGDIVIIDRDLDPAPEDYVVVHIKARNQNVFRKFTYGTNGEVLLTPINASYERFRFSAEEWLDKTILVGVTSEYTRPRRT
jgi:phage repressor protein C with HTH and peptisase S24 domain